MSAAVEVSRQVLDMFPSVTVGTPLLTGLSSSFILSALFISLPDTSCQGRPKRVQRRTIVCAFSRHLIASAKDNPINIQHQFIAAILTKTPLHISHII